MTDQPHDDLWRDLAADASESDNSLLSSTLAEVRRQRGRRKALRVVAAASIIVIPLALTAIAWQFAPGSSRQVANHSIVETQPEMVEPAEPERSPPETTQLNVPQPKAPENKRPRGKLIVVEEPAPASPEWSVVELTDEELLAEIPAPAKLIDTPQGKELVFQKDRKTIPKVEPNPRRLPSGVTLLSRTRWGSRQ